MIPRLAVAVLLAQLALSGHPLEAGARTSPPPSPAPSSRPADGPPWPVRLKLVHRVLLDRKPGSPADPHSKVGPLPPELAGAGLVAPIVTDRSEVTFLSESGEAVARVPLSQDRNLAVRTFLSPNGLAVSVASTFSSRVTSNEADEGGAWVVQHKMYDRAGRLLYTTDRATDDLLELADNGNSVFVSYHTGELAFIDPATGNVSRTVRPLAGNVTARPRVGISADGQRVLAIADRTVLDGEHRVSKLQRNVPDLLRRGRRECWAMMYDVAGRELWRKLLPVHGTAEAAVLSDDGSLGLLVAEKFLETGLAPAEPVGTAGYVVDAAGTVLASSDLWGGAIADGARYSAEHGGFLLGVPEGGSLELAKPDGTTKVFYAPPNNPLRAIQPLSRDARGGLVAVLGLYKQFRLVLALMDDSVRVLFQRNIGGGEPRAVVRDERDFDIEDGPRVPNGRFPRSEEYWQHPLDYLKRASVRLSADAQFVAVMLSREVRIYRILDHDSRKGGRR